MSGPGLVLGGLGPSGAELLLEGFAAPAGTPPDVPPATKSFSLLPGRILATGVVAITAVGTGTEWGVDNPFAIVSGPAGTLADYTNVSPTRATFTIDISALTGPITISDSDSVTNASISTQLGHGKKHRRGEPRVVEETGL